MSENFSISRSCFCNLLLCSSSYFLSSTSSSTSMFQSSSRPLSLLVESPCTPCPFHTLCCLRSCSTCARNSLIFASWSRDFFPSPLLEDHDPDDHPLVFAEIASLYFPGSPAGMSEWHRLRRHRVQTLVSEENLQIHSFRPSIAMASANTFSARTCPGIQDFLFCVWTPSPPISWPETSNVNAATTTQNEGRHKSPGPRQEHNTKPTNQKQPHSVLNNTEISSESGLAVVRRQPVTSSREETQRSARMFHNLHHDCMFCWYLHSPRRTGRTLAGLGPIQRLVSSWLRRWGWLFIGCVPFARIPFRAHLPIHTMRIVDALGWNWM